ncbi:hypothetical protein [Arenimonas oryziterrae]|uniref:Uncharacterized protein n=1 Tax=Arenimonas oryziterrae DSM 21050 = YC6267 TaxID=1121015 RepID=A0A091BGK3_9GAMM|nr:hypothetical protein [Arenimonas oryziterrae]KFN43465.1 hypothetical protein N789_09325 [Arenimonas oryziterrae DSM 21050 = YC6267]
MQLRLTACLLLAFLAMSAHAQNAPYKPLVDQNRNTTVLPVLDNENGQIKALLLIEPSSVLPQLPSQRIIKPANGADRSLLLNNGLQLRAGISLDANPGVGVLCNSRSVITTVGSLAGHCLLANFNSSSDLVLPGRGSVNGSLQARRGGAQLTASLGMGQDLLDGNATMIGGIPADRRLLSSLLGPGNAGIDERNASLVGQIAVGDQGWVRIGGTLARARLIQTADLPGGLPPEWRTGSLSLGGGVGSIGGEITGQMIEVPGQPQRFSALGAGVTWRTPWRAKLSVGAENIVTRGKNPFGLPDARTDSGSEEGRVPYVRYQQDL